MKTLERFENGYAASQHMINNYIFEDFLSKIISDLRPYLLSELDKAQARIKKCIKNKQLNVAGYNCGQYRNIKRNLSKIENLID